MSVTPGTLALLALIGLFAGGLGAFIGIGGGVLLVPALTLLLGVDLKVAIATSLLAVIVTSTTAGSVSDGRGFTNTRLAISLELATTTGGIVGGLVGVLVPPTVLLGVFGVVMGVTAALMFRGAAAPSEREVDRSASPELVGEEIGRLAGSYVDVARGGVTRYEVERFPLGFAVSLFAGAVSGLLGVGGGFMKVPAMNLGMNVPIRVAAATSNFMIGVTAAASVFVYFGRGFVHPLLVAPVLLGVFVGVLVSKRTSVSAPPATLKRTLAVVLLVVSVEMALRALGVSLVG